MANLRRPNGAPRASAPRSGAILALSVALLGAATPARAVQKPSPAISEVSAEAAVEKAVREAMTRRRIPGISVAVVRDGKPILLKGYGVADQEKGAPAAAETVYPLASVTKQFTATAIMQLVQDGKLKLETSVTEVLPDLPQAWKAVTIRHLLDHTSGIHSYTSVPALHVDPAKAYTPAELLKLVRDLPLDFQPGEKFEYNNTGYYLLGMVIEKVGGKPYGEFLRERIFQPLGMNDTRLDDPKPSGPRRATGYVFNGTDLRKAPVTHPSQPFSAGALVSTVADMAKWDAALYTEKLLKKPLLDQMWTSTKLKDGNEPGYGFGWSLNRTRGHRVVSHGGGILGFSTQITRLPDDRLTVIVLTNQQNGMAEGIAREIAAVYLPDLAPKPIADADPKTTARHQAELKAIIAGMARQESFTEDAQKALFPDRIKQGADSLRRLGEMRAWELMERRADGGLTTHRYRVRFDGMVLMATFAVTEQGKIAGLNLGPG